MAANLPRRHEPVNPEPDDDLDIPLPDVVVTVPNLFAAFACEWMGRRYQFWPAEPEGDT